MRLCKYIEAPLFYIASIISFMKGTNEKEEKSNKIWGRKCWMAKRVAKHWLQCVAIINDGSSKCDDGKFIFSFFILLFKPEKRSSFRSKKSLIVCLRWKVATKRRCVTENHSNLLNLVTLMNVNYVLIKLYFKKV